MCKPFIASIRAQVKFVLNIKYLIVSDSNCSIKVARVEITKKLNAFDVLYSLVWYQVHLCTN